VVAFLEYDLLVKKASVITDFIMNSLDRYGVDAHFAPIANRRHRFYSTCLQADANWRSIYGTGGPINGVRPPKGIIKIDFTQ
jgi:hypothetical protein